MLTIYDDHHKYITINDKRWQYLIYDNCCYHSNSLNDHFDNQSGVYHIQYQ